MISTSSSRHRPGTVGILLAITLSMAQAGVIFSDFGTGTGNGDLSYEVGNIVVAADGSGNGYGNGNPGNLAMSDVGGGSVGSNAINVFYGRFLWAPGNPNDYINYSAVSGGGRVSFHSDNNADQGGTRVRLFDTGGAAVPNLDLSPSPTGVTLVVFRIEMSGADRAGSETVKIWYNPTSFGDVAAGLNPSGSGVVDLFDSTHRGFSVANPQISGNAGQTQYDNIVFGDAAADVLTSLLPPPVVNSFTANATEVTAGTEVTLSWDVSDADSVEISPEVGVVANQVGSQSVFVSQTTIYSLTASSAGGEPNERLQITVDGLAFPPVITEFMASNLDGLRDGRGFASDWIEIHNPNLYGLDLSGYSLTDDPGDLTKWVFPAGAGLAGDEYLVVFASGDSLPDPAGHLHTNFALDAGGEYLALVAPDGSTIIHEFTPTFPTQQEDVSYSPGGYHLSPTPGAANDDTTVAGFVADTKFNPDRGLYTDPIGVTITTATSSASIFYTIDGSKPSPSNGTLYVEPVQISATTVLRAAAFFENYQPSDSDSHSYLFVDQVGSQGNSPAGYPANWGGGPADYEMDPEVVGVQAPGLLEDSLKSLPTISLAMDVADMFGSGGIYANPSGEGSSWERPASAELIYPNVTQTGFGINCGVRIQGKSSRTDETPKHSLSLRFRKEYGPGKLKFPIFKDDPLGGDAIERFDFLQLRAVSNFSFHHWHYYQARNAHPNRDGFGRDLYLKMGHHNTHGRWVHLYINGLYWGVYNLHERGDGDHMANYFGGEPADYDTLKENRPLNGNTSAWATLRGIVDSDSIGSATQYARVSDYLDIDAFIDYVLLNFYLGNRDWGSQNWMVSRRRAVGEPFHMLTWDMEFSMSPLNDSSATMSQALDTDITGYDFPPSPNHVHQRLRLNPSYRQRFADRIQHHCFGTGVLSPTAASELWTLRAEILDRALRAESARWGDHRRDINPSSQGHQSSDFDLYTVENTTRPVSDYLVESYFPVRRDVIVQQLRNDNLYPSVDAPVLTPGSGPISTGVVISNPNPTGSIIYTTDGSDPINSTTALTYSAPVNLTASGPVRVRILDRAEWSALVEAVYIVGPPAADGNLVVSEIYYNPPGPGEETEFIEVMNVSGGPIDLTGVSFTAGISYTFPVNTTLAAGERISIASGTYTGQLDNGGEQLTLSDAEDGIIESFSYNDKHPWPETIDGDGFSLVRVAPLDLLDPALPESWRASVNMGGSPGGSDERPAFSGAPNADLDANGIPDLIDHATAGIDIQFVAGELLVSRALGADDVILLHECSTDLSNWAGLDTHFQRLSETQIDGILTVRYRVRPTNQSAARLFFRSRAIFR
ncbi:MAG: lamin tail domain-containing protein [Akkermansiaceae bacterium]